MSFVYTLINFVLLLALLRFAGRNAVRAFFRRRHDAVVEAIAAGDRSRAAAQARLSAARARYEHLNTEIAEMQKGIAHAGELARAELMARARESADRIAHESTLAHRQQLRQLMRDVQRRALSAAFAQVERRFQQGELAQGDIMDASLHTLQELGRFSMADDTASSCGRNA